MSTYQGLKPEKLWQAFQQINEVPRPSKKEEKIIAFLLKWAKDHNIAAKKDEIGNILMSKPASKGMENAPSVILQSHMDMVCEKNNDTKFDFDNDPIQAYIDGDWVKARGTTLGADDGIGMAAQMAILADDSVIHGPLECLFTVDEETGLTGAFGLEPGFFKSKIMLNLDSEDEGEIFIGCAGGIDTVAKFDFEKIPVPQAHTAYRVYVSGLKGGHSGDEIEKGLGNSNKILNRILWAASDDYDLKLSVFDGGNLRNAIPREAFAIAVVPDSEAAAFEGFVNHFEKEVKFELSENAPGLKITTEKVALPDYIIDENTQYNLLNAIYACPHGVIAMSFKLKGLVETSTNLASVKFTSNNQIIVTTSQRSSIESSKYDVANMVASVFSLAGADYEHGDGYPGWAPNPDSEVLKIAVSSYEKLFGNKPAVRAIHAGLECGLFLEKYPGLDMISFGPTLRGVHSPDEKINIPSVEKWWKHLIDLLANIK